MLRGHVAGRAVPRQRDWLACVTADLVSACEAPLEAPGEGAVQHHVLESLAFHEEELLGAPAACDLGVVHKGKLLQERGVRRDLD